MTTRGKPHLQPVVVLIDEINEYLKRTKDEDMSEKDLLEYLKTQFTDLDGAKKFMRRWVVEMGQMLPGGFSITCRSLAAHCSAVLEGNAYPNSVDGRSTHYISSKYGSELYFAAWGPVDQ